MAELKEYKPGYYLWHYVPSLAGAVLFIILFIIMTAAHCYRLYKTKQWFCIPLVVGGIMEVIGFIGRAEAHENTDQLMPYILQSMFLLLPPVFFAASVYMVLGRIIRVARGEKYSLIRLTIITKTFVWSDVLSFLVQSTGAGMMATGNSMSSMGQKIVIGGLFIQIIMFTFFGTVAVVFHYRYEHFSVDAVAVKTARWKKNLFMLYGVSIFIMIRSIFRVFEFVLGDDGYPMAHEWTLYIFDALLMFLVMVLYVVWYPDQLKSPIINMEHIDSSEQLQYSNGLTTMSIEYPTIPRAKTNQVV